MQGIKKFIKWGIIVLCVLIIGAVGIIRIYKYVFSSKDVHNYIVNNFPIITERGKQFLKITDILYIKNYFEEDNTPLLNIYIKGEDLYEMNMSLPEKKKKSALLEYEGEQHIVKIKYRGASSIHWKNPKKSLRIEMQGNDRFEGMTNFNLIVPEDRGYISEDFSYYVAKKLDIKTLNSGFYRVSINNGDKSLYFMVEQPSLGFLERNNIAVGSSMYKNEANERPERNSFSSTIYWQKLENGDTEKKDFSLLESLLESIKNNNDPSEFINLDNFLRWNAHAIIVNSTHQTSQANTNIYFDNETKKFNFIPWDTAQQDHKAVEISYSKLIPYVLDDPILLNERNKIIWNYLKNDNLEDDITYLNDKSIFIRSAFYKDFKKEIPNLTLNKWTEYYKVAVERRYEQLKKALQDCRISRDLTYLDEKKVKLVLTSNGFASGVFDINKISKGEYNKSIFNVYEDTNNNGKFDKNDKKAIDTQLIYTKRDFGDSKEYEIKLIKTEFVYFVVTKQPVFTKENYDKEWTIEIKNAVTDKPI